MYIDYNGQPEGPLWGINSLEIGHDVNGDEHTFQVFPDICNDGLRVDRKPMHFYVMPNSVRLAKNEQGKYMFHFAKFAGVLTQDSNIGTKGQEEVVGGVLSLTSTMELPAGVLDSLKAAIKAKIKADETYRTHQLYQLDDSQPPFELGFVPIEDNQVAVSNLTLNDLTDPSKQATDDKWLWRMQGQGLGSLDPNGTNACTAMVGQYPAALIEAGFKGDSSSIFVHSALKLRFRVPAIKIITHTDYHKIYSAISSNDKYKDDWNQKNIHDFFDVNNLWGNITTRISFGEQDMPEKDKQAYLDLAQKARDKAVENVQKYIFDKKDKPVAQAEAAKTSSTQTVVTHRDSFFGIWNSTDYARVASDEGHSYALNTKFDASNINMDDEIDIEGPYMVTTAVSGDMKGFFQEIKADPNAKKEYFDFVNLGEAFRKIHVIATSRANWPDDQGNGDPIDKLSIEVGYPDQDGVIQYKDSGRYYDTLGKKLSDDFKPSIWNKDDKDTVFVFDFAIDENVPVDKRNKISVKRTVTYKMDDRVKVNKDNEIVIPDETTSNTQIEVKADILGHLKVGPVYLAADLNKHMLVEVTFNKDGFDPVTLMFTADNVTAKQYFQVWTGESTGAIAWTYKVKVTYKSFGPMAAISYEGDDVEMQGSYPNGITINLPAAPNDLLPKLMAFKAQAKALDALDS